MATITLISTRPRIIRSDQSVLHESVLEITFCQSHGITEILMPAFELSTRPEALEDIQQWLNAVQGSPANTCMVVFVSPGALELLRPSFPQPWPTWLNVGLMGEGSAIKAIGLGIPQQLLSFPSLQNGESQDSAALLTHLQRKASLKHVMLLKGPRGRDDFSQRLRSSGIKVQICQAYHRSANQYALQHLEHQGIVNPRESALYFYLTSSEAVSVFSDTTTKLNASGVPNPYSTLVTHPRIAEAATAAHYQNVLLIEPGRRALEKCLSQQIRT